MQEISLFFGLLAKKMGLPIKYFIAVQNDNNALYNYVKTGKYLPKTTKQT